jgi:hypothetical protein
VHDCASSLHRAKRANAKLGSSFYSSGEQLKSKSIIAFLVLGILFGAALSARSQQPTQPNDRRHFNQDDRISMHDWYRLHRDELPLGLRKKDRLPSDQEKQLAVNEVLPEDLRARVHEASSDFLGRVPPVAEGCHYVFIGGHAVVLERKTNYVYDIYDFQKNK